MELGTIILLLYVVSVLSAWLIMAHWERDDGHLLKNWRFVDHVVICLLSLTGFIVIVIGLCIKIKEFGIENPFTKEREWWWKRELTITHEKFNETRHP